MSVGVRSGERRTTPEKALLPNYGFDSAPCMMQLTWAPAGHLLS